jgi:hypothetical protein
VGLGLLKTTPPSGTVKGNIFPVSNTDVVENGMWRKRYNHEMYS